MDRKASRPLFSWAPGSDAAAGPQPVHSEAGPKQARVRFTSGSRPVRTGPCLSSCPSSLTSALSLSPPVAPPVALFLTLSRFLLLPFALLPLVIRRKKPSTAGGGLRGTSTPQEMRTSTARRPGHKIRVYALPGIRRAAERPWHRHTVPTSGRPPGDKNHTEPSSTGPS